jgi:nitrous oxidase accessory protein NosD
MSKDSKSVRRVVRFAGCLAIAAVALAAAPAWASAATLFVAPSGSNAAGCTSTHPCRTITHAVSVASAGDRVVVRSGTYHEDVIVQKRVHLIGRNWPVVNAIGRLNGIVLAGPGSVGASLRGFQVSNANQEGIVAINTSWVRIVGNIVSHNDLGMFSANPTGECAAFGEVPGDCGEGIHLMTVAHSAVLGNRITANAGGILMTDEFGPTFRNTVAWNRVWRNQYDCGITIPGHSPNALSATGELQPTMGGVYQNLIIHNVVNRNGLKGEGAGILIAAAGPGSAAYDNTVAYNTAIGNNLAGVTIHSHAPNQDVNGNRLIGNTLSNNNRGGDPDAGVTRTADVLIFSAVVPITGTVISDNWLSNAHFGIWTQNAHASLSGNHFENIVVPVHQG